MSCAIGRPGPQLDRHAREVVELQRQRALPARVAEAGGRVDDQPEPPERGLALDPRDDVVRQLDPLLGAPEAELAGVDDERLVLARRRPARSGRSAGRFRSIAVTRWLWKTRNESPSRRSTLAGCTIVWSQGSITIRPSSTSWRIVPSERTEVGLIAASLARRPGGSARGGAIRNERRRGVSAAACAPGRRRCACGGARRRAAVRAAARAARERAARMQGAARAAVAVAAARSRRPAPGARPTRRCTAAARSGSSARPSGT